MLLTASEDTTVCAWDISGSTKESRVLNPTATYTVHEAWVEVRCRVVYAMAADPLPRRMSLGPSCSSLYLPPSGTMANL